MRILDDEMRVAVLLRLLGDELAAPALAALPPDRATLVRQKLAELETRPPAPDETERVLVEFQRLTRLLEQVAPAAVEEDAAREDDDDEENTVEDSEPDVIPFKATSDPFADLGRLPPERVAGALRREHSRTVALVLGCLESSRAGEVLKQLPEEKRTEVFVQLNSARGGSRQALERMVRTTIEAARQLDMRQLAAESADHEQKLAQMLRVMQRKERTKMLDALQEQNPDSAERIKSLLYAFSDLLRCDDRTLQKLLGQVDTTTLGTALKDADRALAERILANLSRRARESLEEEIALKPAVPPDEREAAEQQIVKAMLVLDEAGELNMK